MVMLTGIAGCVEQAEPALEAVPPHWARDLPTMATLANRTITADGAAWRDLDVEGLFSNKGLIVWVELSANGSAAFPAEVQVGHAWAIRDSLAWNTTLRAVDDHGNAAPHRAGVAQDGPRWPVGTPFDLVVEISAPNSPPVLVAVLGLVIKGR
jgi:hypothetical protein